VFRISVQDWRREAKAGWRVAHRSRPPERSAFVVAGKETLVDVRGRIANEMWSMDHPEVHGAVQVQRFESVDHLPSLDSKRPWTKSHEPRLSDTELRWARGLDKSSIAQRYMRYTLIYCPEQATLELV
jgi:hypothetical protein